MIPEIGHFCLILALFSALLQALFPRACGRDAAFAFLVLVSLSFVALTASYVTSDFSVANVAANSHSLKPLLYKVTGVWSNHEGSMMLWLLILASWTFALARARLDVTPDFAARALQSQGVIAAGFSAFILLTSNPFLRLYPPAMEGMDMNPVLQDPALAIHPPLLYMGYVGFSAAFSIAVAALAEKKADAEIARAMKVFVLTAFAFLTAGIALGSFWAYYELGWGGFWFWDPVENASLLPWLAGAALLHSRAVMEKRGALKSWTLFLCLLAFSFSLLGTFLVRSGVLTSVHAFASDPRRGMFILLMLSIVAGGSFSLFAWRAPLIKATVQMRPLSREGAVLVNNILLFVFSSAVFMGTLYPIFMSALDAGDISVGAPYYKAVLMPLLPPFALLLGASFFLPWKKATAAKVLAPLLAPLMMSGIVAFVLAQDILTFVAIFAGVFILAAALRDMWDKRGSVRQWTRGYKAMHLAHAGIAFVMLGAIAATAYGTEKILWMSAGDAVDVAGRHVTFLGADDALGPNYNMTRALFTEDGRYLAPEKRWYPVTGRETSETAITPHGLSLTYAVLGDAGKDGRFVTRFYHHPFILLIYLGAAMIAGGSWLARKRGAA